MFVRWTGVTVDSTLDGIRARPELFSQSARKVPDVNFFYRYGHVMPLTDNNVKRFNKYYF